MFRISDLGFRISPNSLSENSWGFTLLELLIAILIFAVIVSAVYSTLYSGIKVWNEGDAKTRFLESSQMALNRMTKDIRNVTEFSEIKFEGEKHSISMPVIKDVYQDKNLITQIYKVSYYLDSDNIMRDAQTYPESLRGQTKKRELVSGIQELVFSYCNVEKEWKDSWEEGSPPYAVKLSIKSKEDNILEAITEIPIFDTGIN
ncbi:MAG: type II secretion system protein GspJ [bacterium]